MKTLLTAWGVILVMVSGVSGGGGGETPAPLKAMIEEALERNPDLEAALHKAEAAQQAVRAAGALPDPRLTLGVMNLPTDSFAFDREPMTGLSISVMQMFPFPGKQGLAAEMAKAEAAALGFQREEVRNQLEAVVRQAYYGLYTVDRALDIVARNRISLESFARVAETRYAAGAGLQQDVLRAHVELARLDDVRMAWEEKRRGEEARLNALLGRPQGEPVKIPAEEPAFPRTLPPAPSLEEIEAARPLLRAWRERLDGAEAAVALARRRFWPDFSVGLAYSRRGTLENGVDLPDFFSATVSIDIPLHLRRKQQVDLAVKRIDRESLRLKYEDVLARIAAEVERLRAGMERSRRRAELYKESLLFQSRRALESALAGYRVGKVDFLTLLNNWTMLRNDELQYHFALAEYHKQRAAYSSEIGLPEPGGGAEDENGSMGSGERSI